MVEGLSRGGAGAAEMRILSQQEIDALLANQEAEEQIEKQEGTEEQRREVDYINFLLDKVATWHKIGSDMDAQKYWNDANMRFDSISDQLPAPARTKLLDRLNELSQGKRKIGK